ncbi:uncharacterized protein LOC132703751 [Cylas formicarius]|uniref:uncharacterized protein LOC132703751 n=1 Tax=Cylas formicarius TaxID=197179 RepID=UPI0029584B14|nr:uncharacterized protein LOC132703751 [Cylas formicarius]
MPLLENLEFASKELIHAFVNSFDHICFDIDGVLMLAEHPIPGAKEFLSKMRKLGKNVIFASNNSVSFLETLIERLKHFDASENEIITPNEALIDYMRDVNFKGNVFVVGGNATKKHLKDADYNVVDFQPENIEECLTALRDVCLQAYNSGRSIGAVVLDFDLNFGLLKAQRVINILNANKNALLFVGCRDDKGPLSKELVMLGPKFYIDAVERTTNRIGIPFAKPSVLFRDALRQKYDIKNPARVLFVGDSTFSDVGFANMCDFQSLLVLTGTTKKDDVLNWCFPKDDKPNFYVANLKELYELLVKYDM